MKKIVYVTGTRAEYGIVSNLLKKLDKSRYFNVEIAVTGMHLMKKFGYSANEIKKDRLNMIKIYSVFKNNKKSSMLLFFGGFIEKLTKKIEKLKPDFIFVVGDRVEALGGAIVGSYLSIPVVHFHGGEVTSTIDEVARHAITKLSHIHFCATKNSEKRIVKMGEDRFRVKVVGAPSLDNIKNTKIIPKKRLFRKYGFNYNSKLVLVLQHPVTLEKNSNKNMLNILESVKELGHQALVVYPNADPGSHGIIKAIEKFRSNQKFIIKKNLPYEEFVSFMNCADVMVGNSSSGIIEAPYFKLPVVNVGPRQNGRERSNNVIDCSYNKNEIKKCVKYAFSSNFKKKIRNLKNPYGSGNTYNKVLAYLKNIKTDKRLLQKAITY